MVSNVSILINFMIPKITSNDFFPKLKILGLIFRKTNSVD
ncbi:hypothetical protein SAMN02799633_01625 [Bacillus sp. UNCCL81]|nr:hypothetical protein SAMN02799633_01625 [Bacillus sp. UNCCL81]